jgi:UDP-N-acetylmuramyl pentapeptide phosphotransferase/UDP-N-acetylglucosamine-1-phosphate transferase
MKTYLFVYLGSACVALVTTPIVIMLSHRLRIFTVPGVRHVHERPISHIGGIAIFFSMMSLMIPVLFLSNVIGEAFRNILPRLIVLLSAGSFIFFIGLVDDLKAKGLRAGTKFLAQILATLAVCAAGIRIESVAVGNWFTLDFGWFSWPLTLLWIIGITNAINLSDGLDGLAAGVSAIACGVIAIFAVYSGQLVMAILMLALLGSLTGFLFFNFSPAKIFMGDCGSMFLGFIIASSSVLCSVKSSAMVGLALPMLALGIPIFDTLFSMLRRYLERRSIFSADRRHFHHRLIDMGLKQRHVVMTIYVLTLLFAGLGMFMMVARDIYSLVIFLCIILLLILVFFVVGSVRLKETIVGLRRKYTISRETKEEIKNFEDAQLYFHRADVFNNWWQAVSTAAEKMGFISLSMDIINRDGSERKMTWRQDTKKENVENDVLRLDVPIRDRRPGSSLNLKIEICKNGSLESAGRRIALFTRLIDEHDIPALQDNKKI